MARGRATARASLRHRGVVLMLRDRIGQLTRRGAARKRRGRNAMMRDGGCSQEFGRASLSAKWKFGYGRGDWFIDCGGLAAG